MSLGNGFILVSEDQRSRSLVTKTLPAWVFALLWVLASSRYYYFGYRCGYLDDVEEVVVVKRVNDLLDSRFGNLHAQTFHAAARVDKDHHVLRRRRRLDVPAHVIARTPTLLYMWRQRWRHYQPRPTLAIQIFTQQLIFQPISWKFLFFF